jgi:hypothetical protein
MQANWDFDFSVRTSTPIVTVAAGRSAAVLITVAILRGLPQSIHLAVATDWSTAGIAAQVTPRTLPGGGIAKLNVVVSEATPPGTYMIGVQGAVEGLHRTSEAMVTVVVQPAPKNQDDDSGKQQQEQQTGSQPDQAPGGKAGKGRLPGSSGKRTGGRGPMQAFTSLLVLAVIAVGLYFLNQEYDFMDLFFSNLPASEVTSSASSTYVGTQTFTIFSAMGGARSPPRAAPVLR